MKNSAASAIFDTAFFVSEAFFRSNVIGYSYPSAGCPPVRVVPALDEVEDPHFTFTLISGLVANGQRD